MSTSTHYRICPVCEACCGLEVQVEAGRVKSIRGHAGDPFSQGYVCPKGVALKDLHEDPDRLRKPLVRRRGRFEEVGWDEAFAEIERRLPPVAAAHGRDAVGLVIGNPTAHKVGLFTYLPRLLKALGTRSVFTAATLDQMPRHLASGLLYGHWMSVPVPDIERTDFLLMLGANPVASNGSMWTVPDFRGKAKALRARGGRLVVVDPRRTETAQAADEHLFIRPGGDAFLLLGMVHTLFAEQLLRPGRLEPMLAGVEAVRQAVQPFAPAAVAARCGIDAATIRRLAQELAAAPRAAVYGRIGICTQEYGSLASWLVDVLNALTGRLDAIGGAMFPRAPALAANTQGAPGRGRGVALGRHTSRVGGVPETMGELPITCLAEEIEGRAGVADGPRLRALITVAGNPVLSAPNGRRLAQALDGLDFMVSLDIYRNETTRHADVVLPGPSPLEEMHYDVAFSQLSWRNQARYSEAVLPAPAGQPAEWENLLRLAAIASGRGAATDLQAFDDELLAQDLARQFGAQAPALLAATAGLRGPDRLLELGLRGGPYGDGFGARPEGLTLARLRAAPAGIDLGALQPRLPELLRTPSGQVELAPPQLLAEAARAAADLARPQPPLVVIGRRDVRSNNSWMHNLPLLAKGPMRCTVLVHPADAARRGLAQGAMARIRSAQHADRSVQAQVELSAAMMPGVVSLPHGWGHDLPGTQLALAAERPGANLNALLDENARDPLTGNAVLSGVAVELEALAP